MVYHGPSKGCRACRKRRVKCDEGKPACNNCIKRKVDCPGYESTFDYRHRNETASTISKVQQKSEFARRKSSVSETSSTSTGSPPEVDVIEIVDIPLESSPAEWAVSYPALSPASSHFSELSASPGLNVGLDNDPESISLTWYFTNYPWAAVDPQSKHGFIGLLQPLYLTSPKDSPLRPAITALASNLLMLFCHQGSDSTVARRFYAQSVSRMNKQLADPVRSKHDDMILTTLTLNFYDMINLRWSHDLSNYDNHKTGAVALLKHRGRANFMTERSRWLTSCLRNSICHWAFDVGGDIPPDVLKWLTDDSVPANKSSELDIITLKLVDFQSRFKGLFKSLAIDRSNAHTMIEEGFKLDDTFSDWAKTVPGHWLPLHVTAEQVLPSIREAGFYGHRCAVYWDLSICNVWNEYRTRRLALLRILRQLCLDTDKYRYTEEVESIESTMQRLLDETCEVVPTMFGDILNPIRHDQMYEINFPTASNGIATYPNPDHDHPRAAASSGGWLISATLVSMAKLGMREGQLDPFPMREGQFQWILGQLGRMKTIFLLSQPRNPDDWESLRRF